MLNTKTALVTGSTSGIGLGIAGMPLASPSYPHGPYRFVQREHLIITYRSDPDAIRATLPEPLYGGLHFIADLTLPYGRVLHDYRQTAAGALA